MSGQACAGFCGPRYRWEEDEAEKRASVYSDNASETDALPWNWREGTQARLQEAYDFCYTVRPSSRWGKGKKDISDATGNALPPVNQSPGFDGMEQVMAAVGFPSQPLPARRGVLSDDLFESPKDEPVLSSIIPTVKRASREKVGQSGSGSGSGPLMSLPYPFTGYKNQISSDDQVPFPPSPKRSRTSKSSSPEQESGDIEDEEDDNEEEEEEEEEVGASEEPSSQSQSQPRTSGSLSSLGQPVSSRYPFQFRHPTRGNSVSTRASHLTPNSHSSPSNASRSSRSHHSRSTQSTGNIASASPGSPGAGDSSFSAGPSSPASSNIPMPPRHPQPSRGRPRAGTVPAATPSSPTPVAFPRAIGRPRARTRVDSDMTQAFGQPQPAEGDDEELSGEEELMEQPIAEGAHEEDEEEDSVGLLSAGPSPRSSFVGLGHRPSNLSRRSRTSRSSDSSAGSRSRTGSAPSRSRAGSSARSRAQSLIQTLSQASRSSVELVQNARTRANSSMARLEEDMSSPSHSRSGSNTGSSVNGNENHTFGIPLLPPRESAEERIEEVPISRPDSPVEQQLHHSASNVPSEHPSQRTVSPSRHLEVYSGGSGDFAPSVSSHPGISTAAPSFVTDPATLEGSTESSGRTVSSAHGHMVEGTWRPA